MEAEEHRGSDEITEMVCELCRKKGKAKSADGFCVDCVRYFCTKCLAYHTEFLPEHTFKDKKSMPQDVCLQQCSVHDDEIIKFYCSGCIKFFCQLCKKSDHANCKDVKHLPQVVDKLEQGDEFKQFQKEIECLINEVKGIESVIEREKEEIETISANALSKIESTRQHLIESLNKRFQEIKEGVQAMEQRDRSTIENKSVLLSTVKQRIDTMAGVVEKLQKEERRCKLFMTMKDAQRNQKLAEDLCQLKKCNITKYEFEQPQGTDGLLRNALQFEKLVSVSAKKENIVQSGQCPGKEAQKACIAEQLQRPFIKGDVWFVLSIQWFKQWKSYVEFETLDKVGGEVAHPGQIDNTPILKEGTTKLKEHLVKDLDYVLVPDEGWKKLLCWYGMADGQEPLPRNVIEEGYYSKSLTVEVYPWTMHLCENSNIEDQVSKLVSRSDTVEQLEQVMRVLFHINAEKDVRLWNRYMTNMYEQLNKKDNTLQDAGLFNSQFIVIEQKNCDGTWPRSDTSKRQSH